MVLPGPMSGATWANVDMKHAKRILLITLGSFAITIILSGQVRSIELNYIYICNYIAALFGCFLKFYSLNREQISQLLQFLPPLLTR